MSGEVIGLPKFQLIRDFYDGLVGPFTNLKLDSASEKSLIDRLEQIGHLSGSQEVVDELEEIMGKARVDNIRCCKDGSLVVRYSYRKVGEALLANYADNGDLLAYTFVSDEVQPFEISATLCDDSDEYPKVTRWEDVVDFCWMCGSNQGCYVNIGESAGIYMWAWKEDGYECYVLSCMFGFNQHFWIDTKVSSRDEMVQSVKAYLQGGMSAFQASSGGWTASFSQLPKNQTLDLWQALRVECFRATRHGEPRIADTFKCFGFSPDKRIGHNLYLDVGVDCSSRRTVARVRKAAAGDRYLFTNYAGRQDDWIIDGYLALNGDKPSMRRLAEKLGKSPLANYWLRKARGLPLSNDPLPVVPRKPRVRPVDKRQMSLDLSSSDKVV